MSEIEVLEPKGNLDATKAPYFREKITEVLETGAKIVLVDLKNVNFMDSSGLGVLVSAFKALRDADSKLVVCSINEQVRMLFELTEIDKIIKVFANQEEFNKEFNKTVMSTT